MEHGRPDAPRCRTDSSLHPGMSTREMNADHLWSLTIPAASTGPRLPPEIDTLRSGCPCDSWTPLEAKVREFLSKMHRWTLSDAGGTAETDLLIRVALVRSQRGPPIE